MMSIPVSGPMVCPGGVIHPKVCPVGCGLSQGVWPIPWSILGGCVCVVCSGGGECKADPLEVVTPLEGNPPPPPPPPNPTPKVDTPLGKQTLFSEHPQ